MGTLREESRALRPPAVASWARAALPPVVAVVAALVLQVWIRPVMPDFVSKLALDVATSIVLAVSLTMVNGFTGQFSIGHAAFMAVGGYTAAAVVYYGSFRAFGGADVHGGLISTMVNGREAPLVAAGDALFAASIVAGGLVAAACGYVVGLPSLRLRGDYLAIVTLGFGEIVRVLIQSLTTESLSVGASVAETHLASIGAWRGAVTTDDYQTAELIASVPPWLWPRYVGGAIGFSGLPSYTSLFWAWAAALLTLLVAVRLKYSSHGRAFLSIREDEIAAAAMGVNTTKNKVRAFVIAAFFAGVAGALYAHTVGVQLNAGELGFQRSFDIIIMVVLGGLGSISGAALAATLLTLLPEALRDPPSLLRINVEGLASGAGPFDGVSHPWVVLSWWALLPAIVAALFFIYARRPWRAVLLLAAACLAWEALRAFAIVRGVDLSRYRMVIYSLALIMMMIGRPQGLLGIGELWDLRPARRGRSPAGARP